MRRLALGAALALLAPGIASAGDAGGKYAVKGVGLMPCATFTAALAEQAPEAKDALTWLAGYLTAINAAEEGTFDIVSWQSEGLIAQALSGRCAANPDEPLAQAVAAMVATMTPDRVAREDRLVTVKTAERERLLYASVIERMNLRLIEQGASLQTSGSFTDESRAALRSFQRTKGLAVTGFPDAVTLATLFAND